MIIRRNFRYRHPISETLINDYFDEIYQELVNILGINNITAQRDGIIIDRMTSLNTNSALGLEGDDFNCPTHVTDVINRRNDA